MVARGPPSKKKDRSPNAKIAANAVFLPLTALTGPAKQWFWLKDLSPTGVSSIQKGRPAKVKGFDLCTALGTGFCLRAPSCLPSANLFLAYRCAFAFSLLAFLLPVVCCLLFWPVHLPLPFFAIVHSLYCNVDRFWPLFGLYMDM